MIGSSTLMQSYMNKLRHQRGTVCSEEVFLVVDNPKLPCPNQAVALSLYQSHCSTCTPDNAPHRKALSRWNDSSAEDSTSNHGSPGSQNKKSSRWDLGVSRSPVASLKAPCRLPEHTDSFRINLRRFTRRGGFVAKSLSGRLTYGDESLNTTSHSNSNNNAHHGDMILSAEQDDLIQALLKIDTECNSHRRGGIVVPNHQHQRSRTTSLSSCSLQEHDVVFEDIDIDIDTSSHRQSKRQMESIGLACQNVRDKDEEEQNDPSLLLLDDAESSSPHSLEQQHQHQVVSPGATVAQ